LIESGDINDIENYNDVKENGDDDNNDDNNQRDKLEASFEKPQWAIDWENEGWTPFSQKAIKVYETFTEEKRKKLINQRRKKRVLKDMRLSRKEVGQMILDGVDSIILASDKRPLPLLERLLQFLLPSSSFVIYSEYLEPLIECFQTLKFREDTVNIQVNTSWLRGFQVLPMRTHPDMDLHGSAGYILSGIKVEVEEDLVPVAKKRKL